MICVGFYRELPAKCCRMTCLSGCLVRVTVRATFVLCSIAVYYYSGKLQFLRLGYRIKQCYRGQNQESYPVPPWREKQLEGSSVPPWRGIFYCVVFRRRFPGSTSLSRLMDVRLSYARRFRYDGEFIAFSMLLSSFLFPFLCFESVSALFHLPPDSSLSYNRILSFLYHITY